MSPRAGLNRQMVIDQAIELADERGLDELSMAALAKKCGVRTPSLYNHVASLQDLQDEIALRGLHELASRLARASAGKSKTEAVVALAKAYRSFILENPSMYLATVRSVYHRENPDPAMEAASQESVAIALDVLAPYDFNQTQAIHAVRGLRSLVHGFATLEMAGGFGMPIPTNVSFDYLIRLYTAGLEEPPKSVESTE